MKVCMISEGSYPVARGGVSEWAHQLIGNLPFIDFDIFCLTAAGQTQSFYGGLGNVKGVTMCELGRPGILPKGRTLTRAASAELASCLGAVLTGGPIDCERLPDVLKGYRVTRGWLRSKEYWDCIVRSYEEDYSDGDFAEFFWTANGLYSVLLDTLVSMQQLAGAEVYHALTSGIGGLAGCIAKVMYGSPLVISELGLYLKEMEIELSRQNVSSAARQLVSRYYESVVRTSYRYADILMPTCRSYADHEVELGASQDKIRVVTNGIDCNKFSPNGGRNGGRPIVGCFGRIVPVKGQKTLIEAAKTVLEKHQADFVFVGEVQDEDYFRECQALVRDLGLEQNVKFMGRVDSLAEWYQHADIFALSSQSEGVPLALLEAMSSGLPSVCTAVGGVPDILSDSSAGYVVPANSPDSLASRICELLGDEALRREKGMRARELVKRKYTIERMSQQVLEAYVEALVKEAVSDRSPRG